MKIKANNKFKDRFDSTSSPCSRVEYSKLSRGEVVEVKDEVGGKLIRYGLAEKISSPKPKKVKEIK